MIQRLKPKDRKQQILDAALLIAERKGYMNVTRQDIGEAVGCVNATITYHFTTMRQLQRDMMRAAVRERKLVIISQGIVARDPHALKAPEDVRKEAMAAMQ